MQLCQPVVCVNDVGARCGSCAVAVRVVNSIAAMVLQCGSFSGICDVVSMVIIDDVPLGGHGNICKRIDVARPIDTYTHAHGHYLPQVRRPWLACVNT